MDIGSSDGSEYSIISSSSLLEEETLLACEADVSCLVCERDVTVSDEAVAKLLVFTVWLEEYLQQRQVKKRVMRERMRRPPRTTVIMR